MNRAARPLTTDEIPVLHTTNPSPRVRAVLWLGLCAGLRIGEIRNLDIKHVLTPAGLIRDEIPLGATVLLKRGRPRSIPVNPLLHHALNAYLLQHPRLAEPAAPLFVSRSGGHRISRRQLLRLVADAFRAAGLHGPLSSHTLRKTYATHIYQALGKDLPNTQLALNHRSITSTMHYLETCDAAVRHAIQHLYLDLRAPRLPALLDPTNH